MTQTIRSVELVAGKRYLVETTYVPVWNGTEACGGRTLGTYGAPPPPVAAKPILDIPPYVDAQIEAQALTRERRRRARPPVAQKPRPVVARPVVTRFRSERARGPVFHARPAIWALLAQPVSVSEIRARIGGLPQHALQVALSLLLAAGGIVRAGTRANPVRLPGVKQTSLLYQRAPAYQDAPSWPVLPRRRA